MVVSAATTARALLAVGAATSAPVALAPWTAELLQRLLTTDRAGGQPTFETLLLDCCGLAVLGCTCWLSLAVTISAFDALTGRLPALARRLSPLAVRRLVLLGCGAAVGSTGVMVPACAGTAESVPAPGSGAAALVGLRLPDRIAGPMRDETGGPDVTGYVVRPGDSLWRIARRLLPPDPADPDVAAAVRALYRTNRSTVGPDPDLLHPGQHLDLPRTRPADREDAS